jgi:hypothetical protein
MANFNLCSGVVYRCYKIFKGEVAGVANRQACCQYAPDGACVVEEKKGPCENVWPYRAEEVLTERLCNPARGVEK